MKSNLRIKVMLRVYDPSSDRAVTASRQPRSTWRWASERRAREFAHIAVEDCFTRAMNRLEARR